jgi:hypothetical protein
MYETAECHKYVISLMWWTFFYAERCFHLIEVRASRDVMGLCLGLNDFMVKGDRLLPHSLIKKELIKFDIRAKLGMQRLNLAENIEPVPP